MKVNQEKIEENNKIKLEVEIEADKVSDALDKAYKKVVKQVNIDGFRKGKVPRAILEKKYGKDVLHKDALDILIPQGYYEAVNEAEIEPVAQPDIVDISQIEAGNSVTFVAEVTVKPEVELGEYKGLGVEEEEIEVSDEDIEEKLETKRSQHAQLVATDRDIVEEGDHTLIDFEGFVDGEAFEGGAGEDYNLEIGSGQFIPGFEEQLIGSKVGEEVEVNVAFPKDYQADDLAGKDALFKVTVKEVKVKEIPQLDDEFAKDLEFDSLEDLKADIREELEEQRKEAKDREFENKLIERVVENAQMDIPEPMVESEVNAMIDMFKQQVQQQGMDFEQYLKMSGMDLDGLKEQYQAPALNRVKSDLVLKAIADLEEIKVNEEELDEKIEEIAQGQGQEKEQFKALLEMQGQLNALKDSLRVQKTIDFLVENN